MTRAIVLLFALTLSAGAQERRFVSVPENHDAKSSRQLELQVTIVPAKQKQHDDPVVVLAGGPGQVAATMVEWVAEKFADVNAARDIVFVDYRGATERNMLYCKLKGSADDPTGYFADLWSGDVVARCREELGARWDLRQYTTANIVRDFEIVRRTLGWRQMNFYGTSYGAKVGREYMRLYPKNVRSAILDGSTPPAFVAPSTYARDAEATLRRVLALCREDEACRTKYPNLESEYEKVLAEATARGIEIVMPDRKVRAKVSRGLFGELMRNVLYSPQMYVHLPRLVHALANGDTTLFAELATEVSIGRRQMVTGLFLSATCTEDIPRMDVERARREAEGTLLGSYRVDLQVAACRQWVRGKDDPRQTRPVHVDVPTLIVAGEYDPVTTAGYATELARMLPKAKLIVVPYAGHGPSSPCVAQVLNAFVKAGTSEGVDVSCVAREPRPKFM